jgi:hypothetical protein
MREGDTMAEPTPDDLDPAPPVPPAPNPAEGDKTAAGSWTSGFWARVFEVATNMSKPGVVVGLGGSLFLLAVIAFFYRLDMSLMKELGFARGVITGLITVAFVVFGFALMARAMYSDKDGDAADKHAENMFRRAREVFAALTGIVGTIVGFYFGAAPTGTPASGVTLAHKLAGTTLKIVASGGPAPFTIRFRAAAKSRSYDSADGFLDVDVCKAGFADWPADLTLEAIDAKRNSVDTALDEDFAAACSHDAGATTDGGVTDGDASTGSP